MTQRSTKVTDWLWFGDCPACETTPGAACLDQRNRLTATTRGQAALSRPHSNREVLSQRLVPFLSRSAREVAPELVRWLMANVEYDSGKGGRGNTERAEAFARVAHELRKARTAQRTSQDDPFWPDRNAAEA